MTQVECRNIVIATIANGAALSDAVNLRGEVLVGVRMSAVWDAANLTFQASMDDVTYMDAYSGAGAEHVVTVAGAGVHIWVDPSNFAGYRWLKVRSGTTGTPVNQTTGADPRVLELITRGIG
jgi:hypothetical protein